MKQKVVVIAGPTASGKTGLAIEVAKRINGEIISSDSMQIYKDMSIGTAKATKEEQAEIKHHLIDFVSPDQRYSVADFKKDAINKIEEILAKGKTPVVVGGTGLYINTLVYNIEYDEEEFDKEYRKELNKKSIEEIYEEAKKIDPEALARISQNDRKRIERILEIYHKTGKTKTEQEKESRKNEIPYDYKIFGIDMPREVLYDRINRRVDIMIEEGLIEEVQNLVKKYKEFPTAMQGLGYKEVVEYFDGKISKEEMIEKIKQESRHYAKRQITWFKKTEGLKWISGTTEEMAEEIVNCL